MAASRMILALIGPPGSGKGSYGKLLAKSFQALFATSSDVLKQEPTIQEHVDKAIQRGGLVDDDVVCDTLLKFLSEQDEQQNIILDGFPRTLRQVEIMEKGWPYRVQVDATISLEVPRFVCETKLVGRRLCPECGGNYNVNGVNYDNFDLPPSLPSPSQLADCPSCRGGELNWTIRKDDHPDIVHNRLDLHFSTIEPVLRYYESKNALLRFWPYLGYQDIPRFQRTLQAWLQDYND